MTPLAGGCVCGSVLYEATGKPQFSFHCHCRQCQKASGAGLSSQIVKPADAVRVTGKLNFFHQQSYGGSRVSRGFCPTSGSPVMSKNSSSPNIRFFHAGGLDDPGRFPPRSVVWFASAQPWNFVAPDICQ